MLKAKGPTKKQHFVPQVYLRGFSLQYKELKIHNKKEKSNIYYYDLIKNEQHMPDVPIKSVCSEKYLYEVFDIENEFVLVNYLETWFSKLEKVFRAYRTKLEKKAFNKCNYHIKCFLSKDEKEFWKIYMTIQILRTPKILKEAESLALEMYGEKINDNIAKNIARRFCLPFFKELEEESLEAALLDYIITPMDKMNFATGVDVEGKLVTSDFPVRIRKNLCNDGYDCIIFPITAKICLFLFDKEKNIQKKNTLFPINDDIRNLIISAMAESANEKIFSNHLLTEEEIKIIQDVIIN